MDGLRTKKDESAVGSHKKKPYIAPELQKWGTLLDITRAAGNAGSSDGGSNGHKSRTRA
jgi:hypothetical protein